MKTRFYFHGDRINADTIYCASCDLPVAGNDHFAVGWCSAPKRIRARLNATQSEYSALSKIGYHRPADAENVFTS
jgi:hypothetical protein